jgi:hypothetical protein
VHTNTIHTLTPPPLTAQDAGRFGIFATEATARHACPGVRGRLKQALGLPPPPATLAAFPLSKALTPQHALDHPQHGKLLRELHGAGVIDDRAAVVLLLLTERLLGRRSDLQPWLSLLPTSFGTPLYWEEEELGWLKGTTLHRAVE